MVKSLGWCRNSWQATSTASIHLVDIGLVNPNQFLKFKKPGKIRLQDTTSSSIWCISSPQTRLRMSCTLSKSQCCQWGFHHLNNLHKLISKHPQPAELADNIAKSPSMLRYLQLVKMHEDASYMVTIWQSPTKNGACKKRGDSPAKYWTL